MTRVVLRRWRAWAPDGGGGALHGEGEWRDWAKAPRCLAHEGQPDVSFLPTSVRRRATRLTRVMLRVAFDCTEGEDRAALRSVFASRHGAIHVAVKILASIAKDEIVSPLQFSHSVHNAQAGLLSIATGNRCASSSVAAGEDTFAHGFLEALLHLERGRDTPVLLVVGDEPLPRNLSHLVDEPKTTYGLALLLTSDGDGVPARRSSGQDDGVPLEFELSASHAPRKDRDWPDALEFVLFLASDAPELTLESGRRRWRWRRVAPAD